MTERTTRRLEKHRRFWNREDTATPLASVTLAPDFFFSTHYRAARHLLDPGQTITPESLDLDLFLADYERLYQESLALDQDGFWVATPFTGMPWMEAMLGCRIVAMESSFVSTPTGATITSQGDIELDPDNPWLKTFLDFTRALVDLSAGRFPVGEPILRGPSDMLGALLGQEAMVYALLWEPDKAAGLLLQLAAAFARVIARQQALIPAFHGGHALGFYNVWTPGKCIWYQEDLSALLSPKLFQAMLRPCAKVICRGYDYTAIHLHPSSFFIVDQLLEMDEIRAIQINKDIGGPSVPKMMEVFRKVVARKNLIVWGDLDGDDLRCLREELPARGVYLHLVVENVARANELLEIVHR